MKKILVLLCLATIVACAQRTETTTQSDIVVINHELDSMQMCINAFDEVCPLGDTVAETDDGCEALEAWDNMLKCDTINMSYARGVFSVLAHEMLLVLDARLDYDSDDHSVVEFNNQWGKFLRYSCDMEE